MELKAEIGVDQAGLCEAILKAVCRVIKEAFPDDAAEVVKAIVRITL